LEEISELLLIFNFWKNGWNFGKKRVVKIDDAITQWAFPFILQEVGRIMEDKIGLNLKHKNYF